MGRRVTWLTKPTAPARRGNTNLGLGSCSTFTITSTKVSGIGSYGWIRLWKDNDLGSDPERFRVLDITADNVNGSDTTWFTIICRRDQLDSDLD